MMIRVTVKMTIWMNANVCGVTMMMIMMLMYFVEHNISYQSSKFQSSRCLVKFYRGQWVEGSGVSASG